MATLALAVNLFQLFAEPTRVRLMALLAHEELTVAELVAITDLGQSSVSTHLGKLREGGLLRDRRAGASTFYALNHGAMSEEARNLWALVERETKDDLLEADRSKLANVLAARSNEAPWHDAVAGQMERHYSPGRTWEATARGLLGLLHMGDVLDVGAGDGTIAELIAPHARSVTCIDTSERMVEAGRRRLKSAKNVRFKLGDGSALSFKDASFDQVLLFNILTQTVSPSKVIAEASRVLKKNGDVVIITLREHPHESIAAAYQHCHHGFSPSTLTKWLVKAKLDVTECRVACKEKRQPQFQVITAFARKR